MGRKRGMSMNIPSVPFIKALVWRDKAFLAVYEKQHI